MNQSYALREQEPVSPDTYTDHNAPAAIRSPTEEEKESTAMLTIFLINLGVQSVLDLRVE